MGRTRAYIARQDRMKQRGRSMGMIVVRRGTVDANRGLLEWMEARMTAAIGRVKAHSMAVS